ncbi:MAG: phosphoribosylamine--glycine ligase [Ignavibacteriaceae bacterium]
MLNVLVIGSGGREHALAWKINQSKSLTKLYCLPGNPGTSNISENINLDVTNGSEMIKFCKEKDIDLVVIGPEKPLVDGLADVLRKSGINVFGPDSSAAMIEASKSFAKEIMLRAGVPTAGYKQFTSDQFETTSDYIKKSSYPLVIKADGLAAGKGVIICYNVQEAIDALNQVFVDKIFGDSGSKLIIEDFLIGEEASIFAVTDGEDFVLLPSSQDHKRIGDNDTGKNTGGMGAYSPAPIVTQKILNTVAEKVIKPTLYQLKTEGKKFVGCLYAGLMINNSDVKVVEFNCRFGDPETQAVLPLIEGDLLQLLYSASKGKIDKLSVSVSDGCAVCVVAASSGYPDFYKTGYEIDGLNQAESDVIIFHAGTKQSDNKIFTNGGRVLGVTAFSNAGDLKEAREKAYAALKSVHFEGMYFRKDIAEKAFK